jgi:hypothetical protein
MKKGQVDPLKIIILAIILLIVVVVVLTVFRQIFGKQTKDISDKVGGLSDFDQDGIADFYDACPCDLTIGTFKEKELSETGCPTQKTLCDTQRGK